MKIIHIFINLTIMEDSSKPRIDIDLRRAFYSADSVDNINKIKTQYIKYMNNSAVIKSKTIDNKIILNRVEKNIKKLPNMLKSDEKRRHKFNQDILDELTQMFEDMRNVSLGETPSSTSTVLYHDSGNHKASSYVKKY